MNSLIVRTLLVIVCLGTISFAKGQNTLTQIDSSLFIKDTLRPFLQKFGNVRFSGYMQTQFQLAQQDGTKTYAGGDFQPGSHSRFMMRRGRIRLDYLLLSEESLPKVYFAFQFDGTERGVNIRDFWGKFYENKYNLFSLTTGVFGRPFGFEINWSSVVREAPERGRMSQILLQTERDLGAMLSFEPQRNSHRYRFLKVDLGFFNGQGLPGRADFDSRKDLITRISVRPVKLLHKTNLSGSVSFYQGGTQQFSKYVYTSANEHTAQPTMKVDSSLTNIGAYSKRQYYSADAQLKVASGWGISELRAEYWQGTQPGSQLSSTSFPSQVEASLPRYVRNFNGAFFNYLQNIVNTKHQFVVKYDFYDPNVKVKGYQIKPGFNLSEGDVRYNTWGVGYLYYMNEHFKVTCWYDMVRNEETDLPGFEKDIEDNVFTFRLQYKF